MSDIFGGESGRLLREDNWGAQDLAEELYAIFLTNPPLTPTKPIEATPDPGQPVMRVQGNDDNSVIFSFTRPDGTVTPITQGQLADAAQGTGGGQQQGSAASSNIFAGKVLSGSGETYDVEIQNSAAQVVEATVPGIDPGATVPPGTYATLIKIGSEYLLMVPLWG